MRFYVTEARSWATSNREAYALAQQDGSRGEYRPIEVPTDKAGLLAFLRQWCALDIVEAADDAPAQSSPGSFGEPDCAPSGGAAHADLTFRADLAQRWDSLPLPFCLDLAALALDRARALASPSEAERTH